ncbi:rubrerythrin family protein [Pyrobaculum sp.]|uniref:VIT1/CCC1 transporter family protein n=1 Tax=Pyrobaculum sp. TaxID=2004705 RepID=UPI00316F1ECB
MVEISSDLQKVAREAALDEYKEYVTYSALARAERNPRRRAVLERLAEQELEHFRFWNKFAGVAPPVLRFRLYAYFMVFVRLLLGATFVAKLLERGEVEAVGRYRSVLPLLPDADREALLKIIADEEGHERALIDQLDEAVVKYMGALVLGLADAIIEITGAHAGTLGTTDSTVVAGVIGLIVGVGAAISMASASYLQAKHDVGKSPGVAALATGLSYIAAVALLSLPYFLLHDVYLAFAASIAVGVFLAFLLTFQGAVYAERDFKFEFLQTVGLLLGTAFLTYLLGDWLGSVFGVKKLVG